MDTKKKKIVSAGIGYTLGNYLIKGLTFLTIPIFARLMDSSDYGVYNTYIAYESIIYIIIGLALHSSFKNAKYKFADTFNDYVSSCVLLGICSSALYFLGINILYGFVGEYLNLDRWVVSLLIFHSFGSALIQYYNAYVGLYYEYAKFLKLSFINAGCNISCSIILILGVFRESKYYGRILGTAIPVIIIGFYIIIFFFKKSKPKRDSVMWKFALNYSLPIIPHGISQVILSQFDRIMITSMVGTAQSGIYSFAYNIYSIIQVTCNSLSNVWEPWFFERMHEKDYESIKNKGFLFGLGMLVFSTILCLVAPEIILILGTSKYAGSIYCVIPIITGGYFSFLYVLPCEIEYYYGKTKYIAMATSVAAVVNIVLNYIFIKSFGYIAAAYTTLSTYLFYFVFHYLMARKIEGRFIYSNLQIGFLVIGALVVCGVSVALTNYIWIRWGLTAVIFLGGIIIIEKRYGLIMALKKRLLKK